MLFPSCRRILLFPLLSSPHGPNKVVLDPSCTWIRCTRVFSWYSNGPFNYDLVETFKTNAFNAFVLDRVIGPFGTCKGSLLVFLGWSTSGWLLGVEQSHFLKPSEMCLCIVFIASDFKALIIHKTKVCGGNHYSPTLIALWITIVIHNVLLFFLHFFFFFCTFFFTHSVLLSFPLFFPYSSFLSFLFLFCFIFPKLSLSILPFQYWAG